MLDLQPAATRSRSRRRFGLAYEQLGDESRSFDGVVRAGLTT